MADDFAQCVSSNDIVLIMANGRNWTGQQYRDAELKLMEEDEITPMMQDVLEELETKHEYTTTMAVENVQETWEKRRQAGNRAAEAIARAKADILEELHAELRAINLKHARSQPGDQSRR